MGAAGTVGAAVVGGTVMWVGALADDGADGAAEGAADRVVGAVTVVGVVGSASTVLQPAPRAMPG